MRAALVTVARTSRLMSSPLSKTRRDATPTPVTRIESGETVTRGQAGTKALVGCRAHLVREWIPVLLRDQHERKDGSEDVEHDSGDERELERERGHGAADRRAHREPHEVEGHRNRERATEPRRIRPALPQGEKNDIERAGGEPDERESEGREHEARRQQHETVADSGQD